LLAIKIKNNTLGGIMKKVLYLLFAFSILLAGCAKASDPFQDEHRMKVVHTYTTVGNPLDMDSYGNMLFIADDFGGYHIYNTNTGASIKSANYFTYAGVPSPLQVKLIRYNHLTKCMILLNRINSSNWQMEFFSLNNPTNPAWLDMSSGDTVDLQSIVIKPSADTSLYDFAIYRSNKPNNKIKYSEINLSNRPVQYDRKEIVTAYPPEKIDVDDQYIYTAYGQLGVTIYNKTTQAEVASFDTPGSATDVKHKDGYIYVADRQAGFRVYKLDSSMNAECVYDYSTTSGYAENIKIKGNYAALSWNSRGVYLFDISDPENVKLVDNLPSSEVGYVNNVLFSDSENNILYAASRDKGVLKIEY
jgi:hypothetical protein